ncbi:hypothetical protein IWX50DRAFT_619768 [Phyllosticta citricarpa]
MEDGRGEMEDEESDGDEEEEEEEEEVRGERDLRCEEEWLLPWWVGCVLIEWLLRTAFASLRCLLALVAGQHFTAPSSPCMYLPLTNLSRPQPGLPEKLDEHRRPHPLVSPTQAPSTPYCPLLLSPPTAHGSPSTDPSIHPLARLPAPPARFHPPIRPANTAHACPERKGEAGSGMAPRNAAPAGRRRDRTGASEGEWTENSDRAAGGGRSGTPPVGRRMEMVGDFGLGFLLMGCCGKGKGQCGACLEEARGEMGSHWIDRLDETGLLFG